MMRNHFSNFLFKGEQKYGHQHWPEFFQMIIILAPAPNSMTPRTKQRSQRNSIDKRGCDIQTLVKKTKDVKPLWLHLHPQRSQRTSARDDGIPGR